MTEESLRKCAMCYCKKLPEFFYIRKNTGMMYKTCITCCKRSKQTTKDKQCDICGKVFCRQDSYEHTHQDSSR